MTIIIESEDQAIADLEETMQELEDQEVTEAIRRAVRVDFADLINERRIS